MSHDPVSLDIALQRVQDGAASDALPVCNDAGDVVGYFVPAARYEEMQARLKEFEDVVLIPFVDTRNMTDAEAIEALTSGKNKR